MKNSFFDSTTDQFSDILAKICIISIPWSSRGMYSNTSSSESFALGPHSLHQTIINVLTEPSPRISFGWNRTWIASWLVDTGYFSLKKPHFVVFFAYVQPYIQHKQIWFILQTICTHKHTENTRVYLCRYRVTHIPTYICGSTLVFQQCTVAWVTEMMSEAQMLQHAIYLCQTWLNTSSYWLGRIRDC